MSEADEGHSTGEGGERTRDLGIAGFEDAAEVGRGGFAVVYRARQPSLRRQVAIKLLAPTDDANQRRFRREGQALGALSGHPNIVDVFETGVTAQGQPYIVMAYLGQGSLADRVDHEGPLPWAEVARIGVKLAGALETAHRSGMLHRDVKPENVLLSDYGEPLLSDFGIARMEEQGTTADSTITASVAHAAPELLEGRPASLVSDVYSLGSTLATLLAGRAPFGRRPEEELVAQMMRIAAEPPPDLRPLGVPDTVCRVLEQALAKDPSRRQGSAAELGRQLQEAQRRGGLPVTDMALVLPEGPPGGASPRRQPPRHGAEQGSEEVTEAPPAPPLDRPGSGAAPDGTRRRVLAGAAFAGAALLAVLVLAANLGTGSGGDTDQVGRSGGTAAGTTSAPLPAGSRQIPVGDDPTAVISTKIGDRALVLVANSGSRSVSVIDAATDQTVSTVALSARPTGIAVNPRSKQLFVTNAEAVLTIVDGTTFQQVGTVELPARPTGVAVNHRENVVYVTSSTTSVWVIDGTTAQLVATVELGSTPLGLDVNPQTNRIYVAGPDEGVVWVIDGETHGVDSSIAVGASACGVAVNPRSNEVYVTRSDAGEVALVSGERGEVRGTVAVGGTPCGVDVNPELGRVYVASQPEGILAVVEADDASVARTFEFPASGPAGPLVADVSTDPDSGQVYVISRSADVVVTLTEG